MLKRFQKINLTPGASQTIHFCLHADDFAFYGVDLSAGRVLEDGTFTLRVGHKADSDTSAPSTLAHTFTLGEVSGASGGTGVECSGPGDPNCAGGGR